MGSMRQLAVFGHMQSVILDNEEIEVGLTVTSVGDVPSADFFRLRRKNAHAFSRWVVLWTHWTHWI